jgi:hypothetical protein
MIRTTMIVRDSFSYSFVVDIAAAAVDDDDDDDEMRKSKMLL